MGSSEYFKLPGKFSLSVKEAVRKPKPFEVHHLVPYHLPSDESQKDRAVELPVLTTGLLGRSHQRFRVWLDSNKGLNAYLGAYKGCGNPLCFEWEE